MRIAPVARRDGYKQAAQARRLLADTHIAKFILDATVEIKDDPRDVIFRNNRRFPIFYVRSPRFHHLYYIVAFKNCKFECSVQDKDVVMARKCIATVKLFCEEQGIVLAQEVA